MIDKHKVETISDEEINTDNVLAFSQKARLAMVKDLLSVQGDLDKDEKKAFLTALKDMDGQALATKRLNLDDKHGSNNALVANALVEISKSLDGKNPFKGNGESNIPNLNIDEIIEIVPVEGEMDIGLSSETYDSFTEKYDKD